MSHLLRAMLVTSMLAGIGSTQAGEAANGWRLNGTEINRLALNGKPAGAPQDLNGVPLKRVIVR